MVLSDVFISYSRKDAAFVDGLNKALIKEGKNVWIDWEDIPFSAKWWDEISGAVEGATTFIAVLSPDYLTSKTCMEEINLAERLNKRIIPVLCRDFAVELNTSNAIAKINWIYFRSADNFQHSFDDLLATINQDLDWVRFHTRLLVRASEWATKKNDNSYHLYGKDLEEALSFTKTGAKKEPPLNTIQKNYIESSQSGAALFQQRQLRGFYLAALIYSIAQIFVIYFWNFNSISETGMIKLSWVWLPGLSFALAGFTIGKRSIKKSIVAMAVVMIGFFLFYAVLWESL